MNSTQSPFHFATMSTPPAPPVPEELPNPPEPLTEAQIIQNSLTCGACKEPAASPIYVCKEYGHVTCGLCFKPNLSCQLCDLHGLDDDETLLQPSPFAEGQSRKIKMMRNCPNASRGCDVTCLATDSKNHFENCEYRPITCKAQIVQEANNCSQCSRKVCYEKFSPSEYPRHLVQNHGEKAVVLGENGINMIFEHTPEAKRKINPGYLILYQGYQPRLLSFDDNYFDMHWTFIGEKSEKKLYWWITIYGGQKDAAQYKYQTQVTWNKGENSAVYNLPVLPWNGNEKYGAGCGNYAMIHESTAADEEEDQKPGWVIKIKIQKKVVVNAAEADDNGVDEADDTGAGDGTEGGTKRAAEETVENESNKKSKT